MIQAFLAHSLLAEVAWITSLHPNLAQEAVMELPIWKLQPSIAPSHGSNALNNGARDCYLKRVGLYQINQSEAVNVANGRGNAPQSQLAD